MIHQLSIEFQTNSVMRINRKNQEKENIQDAH